MFQGDQEGYKQPKRAGWAAKRTMRRPLPLLQEEHSKVMKSRGLFLGTTGFVSN